jgi:hypothetical protein
MKKRRKPIDDLIDARVWIHRHPIGWGGASKRCPMPTARLVDRRAPPAEQKNDGCAAAPTHPFGDQ